MSASELPLERVGTYLHRNERLTRFRIETEHGNLIANLHMRDPLSGCYLWGRHPELEAEYATQWANWVEWDEAEEQASEWFRKAIQVAGSVDLTNHAQPGFVIARCKALENGVVLTAQPAISGALRQILPKPDAPPAEQRVFFQFSVQRAVPGRCQAAVDRMAK